MTAALALEGVSKNYRIAGRPTVAVDGVDLHVDPDEVVWLRGPSGSGKSTVIRIAGLLTPPDRGLVRFAGSAVSLGKAADAVRRDLVGMVFQHDNLLPELTLLDNLRVALRKPRPEAELRSLLAQFDLGDVADSVAKQVSGGQAQRAAICRALAKEPSVLLADEPTSGLDTTNAELVRDRLKAAARSGCAVLVSSHDDHTAQIADRTITLKAGAHV